MINEDCEIEANLAFATHRKYRKPLIGAPCAAVDLSFGRVTWSALTLAWIQPGRRGANAKVDTLPGLFASLGYARCVLRAWRDDYNHVRPHSGIGGLTSAGAARRLVQTRPQGHHDSPGLYL